MKTLFTNAHVISPEVEIKNAFVYIENGVIVNLAKNPPVGLKATNIVDLQGAFLCPGFIDIHAHGANGYDVSDASLASLHQIAKTKLQEGVTTWLPTTLTQSKKELIKTLEICAQYYAAPIYTKCPGVHLEGPFLNPDFCGAQHPGNIRPPSISELKTYLDICNISILSLAPCQSQAQELIEYTRKKGIISSAAHTAATSSEMSTAIDAGLSHLTHFGNAMRGLHHREIGTLGTGLLKPELMLEFIADGHHLCHDFIKLLFHSKPLSSLMLITDSTAASWITSEKSMLAGQSVKIKEGKATLTGTNTLAGSTLKYNEGLKLVSEITGNPLCSIIRTSSLNQAQSLGIPKVGKIEPGYLADLVILDKDFSVLQTYVNGNAML